MPTMAIVGAGPGLGLASARAFGRRGHSVALIARRDELLREMVGLLGEEGIEAQSFVSELGDRAALSDAMRAVDERFGAIDVLQFSPASHRALPGEALVTATAVDPVNLSPMLDAYLMGAVVAGGHVLRQMQRRGCGTMLFISGRASSSTMPALGNFSIAAAGVRSWARNLHRELDGSGVFAAHVIVDAWLGRDPGADPAQVAEALWDLHLTRHTGELVWRSEGAPLNPPRSE